jgi:hypothetical protein
MGRWRRGEWAGGEGAMARQRRASGMCNRLHIRKVKGATSEAVLPLIDGSHQDNLPVQPVAQRQESSAPQGTFYQRPPAYVLRVHWEPRRRRTRKSTHQKESA